jgi:hypothetical protein
VAEVPAIAPSHRLRRRRVWPCMCTRCGRSGGLTLCEERFLSRRTWPVEEGSAEAAEGNPSEIFLVGPTERISSYGACESERDASSSSVEWEQILNTGQKIRSQTEEREGRY